MFNRKTISSCELALFAILFTVSVQSASIASNATCYFPDSSVHKAGVPCRPAAGDGACCENTHACLSNGLCFDTFFNHVIRMSCTDSSWSNAACPKYCTTFAPSGLADIRQCDGQNAQWVCGQNVSTCSSTAASTRFAVSRGLIDDARSTSLSTIFLQAGPTGTTSSSIAANTGSITTITSFVTVAANSANSANFTASSNTGTVAAVGAGVGIPLLLAFLGALWLYLRERKLRKEVLYQGASSSNNEKPVEYGSPASSEFQMSTSPLPVRKDLHHPTVEKRERENDDNAHELLASERRAELS